MMVEKWKPETSPELLGIGLLILLHEEEYHTAVLSYLNQAVILFTEVNRFFFSLSLLCLFQGCIVFFFFFLWTLGTSAFIDLFSPLKINELIKRVWQYWHKDIVRFLQTKFIFPQFWRKLNVFLDFWMYPRL